MRGFGHTRRGSTVIAACLGLLSAVLSPAAAQDCKPLRALASIPMKVENGRYLLPVKINKQDVFLQFISDGVNGIYPEAARELKLPVRDVGMKLINNSGGGSTDSTMLDELQLGQITFGEDRYFHMLESNPNFAVNRIAGTLGPQIVNDVDMDWDFGSNKFNLFSPDHCDGKVVYWKADVVSVLPFEFTLQGEIRVRGKLDGKEFWMLLSTGAATSILNLSRATDALDLDVNAADVESLGSAAEPLYRKRFKSLELNGIVINNPQMYIIPDRMKGRMNQQASTGTSIREDQNRLPDVMIGTNILSKLHIYVATKERRLYITPAAPAPAPAQ